MARAIDLRVDIHINAPVDRVFEVMSDHETFIRDRMTTTRLIRSGAPERNALGARREVHSSGIVRFVEEITAWQRPTSFEYLIVESSLPIKHHGGRMAFIARNGGTDVEWTTKFEIPTFIVGTVATPIAKLILANAFRGFLESAKARLEK